MTTLTAGARLGPYEIRAPIGAGGMGEVCRAHDTKLDRDVAIKILPPALAADPSALARFEREAKAVAALSHRISSPFTISADRGPPSTRRWSCSTRISCCTRTILNPIAGR